MKQVTICFLLATYVNAYGATIIYVGSRNGDPETRQQVELAAEFYGLDVKIIDPTESHSNAALMRVIRDDQPLGMIIAGSALSSLNYDQVRDSTKTAERRLPLLIAGISDHIDPALLLRWSDGDVIGCEMRNAQMSPSYIRASDNRYAGQLGGLSLPLRQTDIPYLVFGSHAKAQYVLSLNGSKPERPLFARAANDTFFAVQLRSAGLPTADPYDEIATFVPLSAQMMFLKYASGAYAWHSPGHYANFTIDDAWLREPYGYVDYDGLLRQMEGRNFHTTIAYVPWNFDRSEPAMVSLFRSHPDRFSVCVHGDNHDHQEFGPYHERSLQGQTDDVKQALARMARFSDLTGIAYDPVMVFPHSIAPTETLAVLKRYNFSATANSLNVPLGARPPENPVFSLRAQTLAFANFTSLRRYSAEAPIPDAQLAIDAFLGNPMLFYAHQEFFSSGINAFNRIADIANQLQPDMEWRSLGYIVDHLYLERLRSDGNYDIRAYAATTDLHNVEKRAKTFFFEKQEDFLLPLIVTVDGQPYPYQRSGTGVRLTLPIPGGQARRIAITYKNGLELAQIDISKRSPRITAIRLLSDVRDNVVSKSEPGRWFIQSYKSSSARWNVALTAALGIMLLGIGTRVRVWRGRSK